jgi:multidrug efflux pump subunit AcrA (membrane-fusion protein)
VNIKYGDNVSEGKVLFEIQTRENKALQQNGTDGGFGKIEVQATTSGMVNEPVTLGEGAYVTEGTPLCILTDINDLMVKVNVPYENHNIVSKGVRCRLFLPDQTQVEGTVSLVRPFVDDISQTQEVLIKPLSLRPLPENMNLTASLLNTESPETQLLPKNALLTNETQDEFWIMKIVDDSIAMIVTVETGIKNDSLVEILSPILNPEDVFILEGGYGLEDSSFVTIVRQP